MAFVKTHWVDDSEPAITAAQLNRIEDGIAEAGESSKAIVLTQAEYDALSDEEKDSDNVYYISDAPFESSNVVPLTRAEYDALSDATKMDGRFYYITDETEVAKSLVVQNNVNSTETVPSSAVVYGLKSDTDSQISDLNDSLTSLVEYIVVSIGRQTSSINVIQNHSFKYGNLVHVAVYIKVLVAISNASTVPLFDIRLNNTLITGHNLRGFVFAASGEGGLFARLESDGYVYESLTNNLAAGAELSFSFDFIDN